MSSTITPTVSYRTRNLEGLKNLLSQKPVPEMLPFCSHVDNLGSLQSQCSATKSSNVAASGQHRKIRSKLAT